MNNQHYVYRQDVIEFMTVGVRFCLVLEHIEEHDKSDFLSQMLQLLPMLYLKTQQLAVPEAELDGYVEQFVTEEDYHYIEQGIKNLLGSDDAYLEVFVDDMRFSDEPITAFISENLADIYQELKNTAFSYQQGEESVMNDAIRACLEAFREHWGQKLVNVLRALHNLSLNTDEADYAEK